MLKKKEWLELLLVIGFFVGFGLILREFGMWESMAVMSVFAITLQRVEKKPFALRLMSYIITVGVTVLVIKWIHSQGWGVDESIKAWGMAIMGGIFLLISVSSLFGFSNASQEKGSGSVLSVYFFGVVIFLPLAYYFMHTGLKLLGYL